LSVFARFVLFPPISPSGFITPVTLEIAPKGVIEASPAWFCSHLLAMIQGCTYHSAIIVKSQQLPTPSESIAIYCDKETSFVWDTSHRDYFYSWCGITHVCSQSIQHLDCTFKLEC